MNIQYGDARLRSSFAHLEGFWDREGGEGRRLDPARARPMR